MAVLIDSGEISATDKINDVPRDKWPALMRLRRDFLKINLAHDCRCLVEFVDDAKIMFAELGFASPEAMIRSGYDLEPEEISVALEWLRLNPPDEPVPLEEAKKLGKQGGDRRSQAFKDQDGNAILKLKPGTHRAYIIARLRRDGFDELADKVEAQEVSANAAAIKAGFRKKPMKRCPNCGHEW